MTNESGSESKISVGSVVVANTVSPNSPDSNVGASLLPSKRTPISKGKRFEIFKRDGFTCIYCGRIPPEVVLHVDHVIPVSKGGTGEDHNLVTSCKECNIGKGAKSIDPLPNRPKPTSEERKEKLEQLRAISEAAIAKQQETEDTLEAIEAHWETLSGEPDFVPYGLEESVKRFLKELTAVEICDAITLAFERCQSTYQGSIFKYFCGICWNKIRYPEEAKRISEFQRTGTKTISTATNGSNPSTAVDAL